MMFYLFLSSTLRGAIHSERFVWTKMRLSDWWGRNWQAVLATLLASAHIPVPPLMMDITPLSAMNICYKIVTSCVNAIMQQLILVGRMPTHPVPGVNIP